MIAALAARQPGIRQRWEALLRADQACSPLASPDVLVHLVDWTLAEFERTDRLDLRTFWTRRARRLLPALFVVLVVVAVYSAFLAGESAAGVRGDTIATLLYSSNWWFIFS